MHTDDRTDALSRYFEPSVYQRDRARQFNFASFSSDANQRERR